MSLVDLKLAALDVSARAVLITDCDGLIVWANSAVEGLTGYDPDSLRGKHTRLFRSGKQPDTFYADLWMTLACGQRWSGRLVNRRKDGSLYTEEMVITPISAGDEEDVHYLAVKEDVSEQLATEDDRRRKSSQIRRLNVELAASLRAGILMVADLAERFSPALGQHARRVADVSVRLARQLRLDGILTDRIRYAALLHDIGKSGDRSDHERHASVGARMLAPIAKLDDLAGIVRHHHEAWDGSGTPDGLSGQAIPIGARIVAVADALDHRLYVQGESMWQAMVAIQNESGTSFDPSVIDALVRELTNPEALAALEVGVRVDVQDLEVGAELTEDVRTRSGVLLYTAGTRINARCLERIRAATDDDPVDGHVAVRRPTAPGSSAVA